MRKTLLLTGLGERLLPRGAGLTKERVGTTPRLSAEPTDCHAATQLSPLATLLGSTTMSLRMDPSGIQAAPKVRMWAQERSLLSSTCGEALAVSLA